jgi:hypothetical protein
MNRMTAIAIFIALTSSTGMTAHAQPASAPDAGANQTQRAAEPVIRCTHHDAGSRAAQPCGVRQAGDAMRLGADVTRQEFECMLSGACGVADRARVNG